MKTSTIVKLASAIVPIFILVMVLGMWGCPQYHVYEQEKAGEAEFKKAEQNRRVKVLEAEARLESAKLDAQSEIERAKGVAGANKIIADGLQGHEEYLRYLWIDKVAGGNVSREVVYVPTEANLPILEARPRTATETLPRSEKTP